jgi:hypothetical protein
VGELAPKGARGRGRAATNRRRAWAACQGAAGLGFPASRRDTGVGRGGDNWGGNRGGTRERGRRLTHGPQGDAGPWASGLAGRVSWV